MGRYATWLGIVSALSDHVSPLRSAGYRQILIPIKSAKQNTANEDGNITDLSW